MTTTSQVRIRELMAWGLDESRHRSQIEEMPPKIERASNKLTFRDPFVNSDPRIDPVSPLVSDLLNQQLGRGDLHEEMKGLDWTTGIVDLRKLIAFQRRLIFDNQVHQTMVPSSDDWPALIHLAFGQPAPISYLALRSEGSHLLLQSENPNLQFRKSGECSHAPIVLHGGSPFFEVAEFRGRWFLRDGYHRAYRLLCAGVANVPSVIVRARTLAELGPVQPWFFDEEILFSARPPLVMDFLDDDLTMEYHRPRLFKTLRVTIEEDLEPRRFDQ